MGLYSLGMDQQVNKWQEVLVMQIQESLGIDGKLKAHDQMVWVDEINNIRNAAEKLGLDGLIYK